MRRFVILYMLLLFIEHINAQVVESPVFDRTDVPSFRVQKVVFTSDTTFVYCSYSAEEGSWANISDKTYLENLRNGERSPIVKVSGIPFGPEKRHFTDTEEVNVVLFFPHVSTDRINIIENEEEEAFNIYGIDLTRTYNSSYTSEEIQRFFEAYEKNEEEEHWHAALEYTQKQIEATNYVEGIRSFASACSMYNMIMVYFNLEEYEKVIETGKEIIDILRELPKDSTHLDVLARAYGTVGSAYQLLKKQDLAAEYMELSLATRRLKEGVGALNYEEYLREMAKKYYYEDNYPKALLYGKEIVDIYENKYCKNPYKYECVYINALNNLCEFYQKMGKTNEAVSLGKRALALSDNGGCDDYVWLKYAIYNNLSSALVNLGRIDEGIVLLEKALSAADNNNVNYDHILLNNARLLLASIYLDNKRDTLRALNEYKYILQQMENSMFVGKKDYPSYTTVLENMYKVYRWSNPDSAMHYLNKVINVQKEWNGDKSIAYANLLLEKIRNLWVSSLSKKKNIDSLLCYTQQATNIIKRHINNTSYNMSRSERYLYWQRYKEFFTWFIPTICGILNTCDGNSLAYDAALFFKGMLLSSEKEFRDMILSSHDDSLIQLYKEYVNNTSLLEEQYNQSSSTIIDSLKSIMNDEEYLLSQKVTRFNRQYKGTDFTWKEVRDKLSDGDVAIEIVSYKSLDDSLTYYDAYVITPKSEAPQLIYICDENTLKNCFFNDSIDYESLSLAIWGDERWHDILDEAKNIYFSASGLLNTLGIEYLPIANGQHLHDRFNLYRLSSTRELCLRHNALTPKSICLFGGLDFDNAAQQTVNDNNSFYLPRSVSDSINKRGGFDALIGSKQEIDQIKHEMTQNRIECAVYEDDRGTERAFKNITSKPINIIHLSTHGMFIPNENNKSCNHHYRFVKNGEVPDMDEEAKALSRSFLVMSGGNKILHQDSIPADNDDGILTALEISHLDFIDLDLVTLSACQTALGAIEAEGVFGLQRAFKKAGANTILASTDKVDDEATCILMVEFYKSLIKGKTKLHSLKEAQKFLRQVQDGKYDNPKYWASFIMLDGLN